MTCQFENFRTNHITKPDCQICHHPLKDPLERRSWGEKLFRYPVIGIGHKANSDGATHCYHKNCIENWLRGSERTSDKCPACRDKITHVNGIEIETYREAVRSENRKKNELELKNQKAEAHRKLVVSLLRVILGD